MTPDTTLCLLGSDHPQFRAGARIAAQVTRGRLTRIGTYTVDQVAIDRTAGRVIITTIQPYEFTATVESYDALLAQPTVQTVPRALWTSRLDCFAPSWIALGARL